MPGQSNNSRRSFVTKLTTAVLGASVFPNIITAADKKRHIESLSREPQKFSANDNIQIAIIGAGGMGNAHLWPDCPFIISYIPYCCRQNNNSYRYCPTLDKMVSLYNKYFSHCPYSYNFNMTNPTEFYSTNGWNIPVAGGLFLFWVLLVSIFLIQAKHYYK